MKALHAINAPRSLFIDSHISVGGKKLLDIGCGGGLFAEAMAERGGQVTAIDPSKELIHTARQHMRAKNLDIDYRISSAAELLKDSENSYDIVSCLEVLEHSSHPQKLIQECALLLRTRGWGFFSTINRTLLSYLFAIVGAEYILKWLPPNTHSYKKLIKPSEIGHWLEESGLTPKFMSGISYDPLTHNFCLSSSVKINYLILAQKTA